VIPESQLYQQEVTRKVFNSTALKIRELGGATREIPNLKQQRKSVLNMAAARRDKRVRFSEQKGPVKHFYRMT